MLFRTVHRRQADPKRNFLISKNQRFKPYLHFPPIDYYCQGHNKDFYQENRKKYRNSKESLF